MHTVKTLLNKLDDILSSVSAITLFIMMMWVSLDVLFRTLFNQPIPGTIEITGEYMMVIIVYLSLSYVQKNKSHVSVDIFIDKMGKVLGVYVSALCNLIGSFILSFICYFNYLGAIDFMNRNVQSTSTLKYPLAPALWIISIGTFLIAFRLLVELVVMIWNLYKPTKSIILDSSNK